MLLYSLRLKLLHLIYTYTTGDSCFFIRSIYQSETSLIRNVFIRTYLKTSEVAVVTYMALLARRYQISLVNEDEQIPTINTKFEQFPTGYQFGIQSKFTKRSIE